MKEEKKEHLIISVNKKHEDKEARIDFPTM
jgi:hypothetical protein